MHTVVCTYQGELSLPAVETYKEERRARTALGAWLGSAFVPESAKRLQDLLQHAQHVAPHDRDNTLPCYLVTQPISAEVDLACTASSGMTVTTMPLNLGALPAFSVEADRVFCLKYIVKVIYHRHLNSNFFRIV